MDEIFDPSYVRFNVKLCPCCAQERPAPTEPGIWEYNEFPTCFTPWVKVTVKYDSENYLVLIKDGAKIWWPNSGEWRKVGDLTYEF